MRSIFLLLIITIILAISSPLGMMAEESGGGGGELSAASTELSNQSIQNEKLSKVETNMADHQQILSEHPSHHHPPNSEEKEMEETNENKINPEQSDDNGYQSNIPPEYRPYIPPATGEHEQGNSQPTRVPTVVPFGGKGEKNQNISEGGDYQKHIPKEYQPYASGNGNPQGEEGSMRMKKTKEEAEVKVHERGGYYEDYRSSSNYGGEQPQQSQQPQQDESWRQYVPRPYRKYLPDYIPSEEKHHIHHHEKHHIDHHEEPKKEDGKETEKELKPDHEEIKKEEKESKAPHHHHDEKKEEKEEKAHHAAHDHHHAETKEREKEKEKDHECKEKCDHHHDHKLMDSASMTEPQMINGNIAVDHSVETSIPQNNLPHDNNNNNNNSGGSSSSIWVSIGVCSAIVLFGSLLYYLVIKGLSRFRQSREIKEILVDDDIGRIPATAMEKTHLLDREIRIYQQILQNEPAMKV